MKPVAVRHEPVKRDYVEGRYGQVHLWRTGGNPPPQPALVCLHATAYSGQTFVPLMERLAPQRAVMAIDTPGYGGSDAPPSPPDFEAYAQALADAIVRSGAADHGPVDLLGYHTGALLATEIAAQSPALVRRLVLIGVPFFGADERPAWRRKLVHETMLGESFDQFRERWVYFIEQRTPGLSLARAFDCFVDELRAYPREWWAHHALFEYDAAARLPLVLHPVCVINPAGALAGNSRAAAALLPHARVIEMPAWGGAPFDLHAQALADEIAAFLTHRKIRRSKVHVASPAT